MKEGSKTRIVAYLPLEPPTKPRSAPKTMPKNATAAKSKLRSKSNRKPLQNVSNAQISLKPSNNLKKTPAVGGQTGDDSLDRLLLVHSDISSLLRQIDELVMQALQLPDNEGKKEIKKFADMLSDIQTSLKPWVPKFQKALSSVSDTAKLEQSKCKPNQSADDIIESPEESKWESLISPSPLVSWRAECNTKGGRQLFLLTPLPQTKSPSSKFWASSVVQTVHPLSLLNAVENADRDLPEAAPAKPITENACGSPENHSKMDCSTFAMTPCLKMSPPKSCILLEPVSEFSKKKIWGPHKCTPFPTAIQSSSSESESSAEDLKVKYPELRGINMSNLKYKKSVEESPNWIVSPPKTCVIMEPSDEELSKNLPDVGVKLELTESTPVVKEATNYVQRGKHPGENTLKKELWTRFETASNHDMACFTPLGFDNSTKKGFLDRLEEAFEI